ncbi:glycosyltransferase family protein [Mobilicoccus massiliensis]|uniref:hypothetical protein n=1 Tax=Mobilicoccus massiliensis TaxID=1522310 RepID=UPI000694EE7A|nr:hypothetical protein [Mobilicoccus massiliensis]
MARLALVIVARDEADLVERAVRSAQHHVDETVVYDVGSPAETRERFSELGARVVEGRWLDDAAACRNAALEAADADWNLVLEGEEWLDAGGEALRAFTTQEPGHVGLVEVCRGVGSGHEGDHPRHLAPRLLPRGVRYEGTHREEPVFDLPMERTGVVVRSDDMETGRWRADRSRNEAVLLQALAVRPGDATLLLQLADELRSSARYAEAADRYSAALQEISTGDERRHAAVIGALESAVKAGRLRDAVALMDEHLSHWQHSPDMAFLVGDLLFEMMLTNPETGPELTPLVETSWKRCLELGERPDLAGAVHGRGSFLAAQNLYVLCLVLGRNEEAEAWAERAGALRVPASSAGGLLG